MMRQLLSPQRRKKRSPEKRARARVCVRVRVRAIGSWEVDSVAPIAHRQCPPISTPLSLLSTPQVHTVSLQCFG
jgi:hypothetical protein